MSPITSVTYHVHTPTLAEVQAVVPFDIDPTDPRTAAWYLLGIVFGRDDEKIWAGSNQSGVSWMRLDVREPIVSIARSLAYDEVYDESSSELMRALMHLDVEGTTAVLTAMLLFQHIDDGTWGPTVEARQAKEGARIAALPVGAPDFNDSSERVQED